MEEIKNEKIKLEIISDLEEGAVEKIQNFLKENEIFACNEAKFKEILNHFCEQTEELIELAINFRFEKLCAVFSDIYVNIM